METEDFVERHGGNSFCRIAGEPGSRGRFGREAYYCRCTLGSRWRFISFGLSCWNILGQIVFAECFLGGLRRRRWGCGDSTLRSCWWKTGFEDVGVGTVGGWGNAGEYLCKLFESCHFFTFRWCEWCSRRWVCEGMDEVSSGNGCCIRRSYVGYCAVVGGDSTVRAMRSARVFGM